MKYLQLKNYRCFEDTGKIEIKPLTFLVGANSSGKSSFLKFFPLLKQSISELRRGVFLWNGHYVDFKDFQNTIRKPNNGNQKEVNKMEVSFYLEECPYVRRMRVGKNSVISQIELTLTLIKDGNHYDKLKQAIINLPEQKIELDFDAPKERVSIKVGKLTSDGLNENITFKMTNALLPRLSFSRGNRMGEESNACLENIENRIKNLSKKDDENNTYFPLFLLKLFTSKNELKETIHEKLGKELSQTKLDEFFDLLCFFNLNNIIDTINVNIYRFADNITYIGPLRKATERYYRFQNLAIDEIEPDGSNLAMYLYNLNENERKDLNDWINSIFDFNIEVQADGGHVELDIKEGSKTSLNLVDVGFGYTQVLPILVNIWKDLRKDANPTKEEKSALEKSEHIIAIEQPELHLHPRMQTKLAELLANVLIESENNHENIRFVIETHSETLLNKIGELVAFEKIKKENVNVVLFNAYNEGMDKAIEIAEFSEDGFLTNWPINFFAGNVD